MSLPVVERRPVLRLAPGVLAVAAAIVALQWMTATPSRAHDGHSHCVPLEAMPQLCTHGPDRAPDGVTAGRSPSLQQLSQRAATASYEPRDGMYAAAALPKVACIGNGRRGPRIQAVYARPRGVPDRYAKVLPLIRRYAANADAYVNRSAAQRRSGRRIRFVTERCKVKVLKVTLSARGDDSLNDTAREMARKGLNKRNRKYLIWMDSNVMCGVGSIQPDDRRSPDNANNVTTGFARVDTSCWGGGVEAHELFHTLGAVQPSAPHSTPAGHCYDEHDAMCYLDGTVSRMRKICKQAGEWQIDCNHDDYFNPRPKRGSYLARHWNTANSRYLEPGVAPPTEPAVDVPAKANRLPGWKLTLRATSRAAGKRTIARWRWQVQTLAGRSHPTCRFSSPARATTQFWCDATTLDVPQVVVTVWDNKGASNVRVLKLPFATPSTPRGTTLTVTPSASSLPTTGGTVALTATLKDTATGKPIIGMPLQLSWFEPLTFASGSAAGRTSAAGSQRWARSLSGTTEFTVFSAGNAVWAARTRGLTVTVPLPPVVVTASAPATFTIPGFPVITGTALPVEPDSWNRIVELHQSSSPSGPWTVVTSTAVGSSGAYRFSETSGWFYLDIPGVRYYRVHKPAADLAAANSPVFAIDGRKTSVTLTVTSTAPRPVAWDSGFGSSTVAFTTAPAADLWSVEVQRCAGTCTAAGAWVPDPDWSSGSAWGGAGDAWINAPAAGAGTYSYRLVVPPTDPAFTSAPSAPFVIDWTN